VENSDEVSVQSNYSIRNHLQDDCVDTSDHKMLREDDFISILDQFNFSELFQHIISGSSVEGEPLSDHVTLM